MTGGRLVLRTLAYHWRVNACVALGAALSSAILAGALTAGDSMRRTLRDLARARLGRTEAALHSANRLFREDLAKALEADLGAPVAPALLLPGTATSADGSRRVGRVQVLGVDRRFGVLADDTPFGAAFTNGVAVNTHVASRLGLRLGDEIVLRVERPSPLARELPLALLRDRTAGWRARVAAIVPDDGLGRFALRAGTMAPLNVFVPLDVLQRELNLGAVANTLLAADGDAASAQAALGRVWQPADAGLELREAAATGELELRTSAVFLNDATARAALDAAPGARGVLTYLVNEARAGERSSPYPFVAALDRPPAPDARDPDSIMLTDWLAEDLGVGTGAVVSPTYFALGPLRELREQTVSLRVAGIVPLAEVADPGLMPAVPGVAEETSCRDWAPGLPMELTRIRPKDEAYWDRHKGAPKAFVSLALGRKLWGGAWGNLTAVRFPPGTESAAVERAIMKRLDPAALGLAFVPVRQQAVGAADQGTDFGRLFLALSSYLVAAALMLTLLVFAFSIERRQEMTGTLSALGYPAGRIRRLLLAEGTAVALIGATVGTAGGLGYARAVLRGLNTVWQAAVVGLPVRFAVTSASLAASWAATVMLAVLAMAFVVRRQCRLSPSELLARVRGGRAGAEGAGLGRRTARVGGVVAAAATGAAVLVLWGAEGLGMSVTGRFLMAGTLLLAAGLAALWAAFVAARAAAPDRVTLGGLGMRNAARRPGRSLLVAGVTACAVFLLVSVGAHRSGGGRAGEGRRSATGGFALYAESAQAIHADLNTPSGRAAYGLDDAAMQGVSVVGMRVRDGDDASCLNLNRAQDPRLLGAHLAALESRGAFRFLRTREGWRARGWEVLARRDASGAVPVAGDQTTVVWGLRKGLGDTLDVRDGRGRPVTLRIAGVLADSVLQGSLIMSDEAFRDLYPEESGQRVFLVDVPAEREQAVAATLGRAMRDMGMDVEPAWRRMQGFESVVGIYVRIFEALGWVGLLLGTVGLAVLALRSAAERRSELAVLRATGFSRRALVGLLAGEHAALLLAGLVCGAGAAGLAVWPALRLSGAMVPLPSLGLTLLAVAGHGLLWVAVAAWAATRGSLVDALREE